MGRFRRHWETASTQAHQFRLPQDDRVDHSCAGPPSPRRSDVPCSWLLTDHDDARPHSLTSTSSTFVTLFPGRVSLMVAASAVPSPSRPLTPACLDSHLTLDPISHLGPHTPSGAHAEKPNTIGCEQPPSCSPPSWRPRPWPAMTLNHHGGCSIRDTSSVSSPTSPCPRRM